MRVVMRSWLFVCGSTILFAVTGHTQVTAYAALRTVGSSRGEKVLSQVLAISGEGSGAQPNRWKVWIDDPAARGGVRELEVSGNQIASERTPVKSEWAGGKDMDLAHLNLDSDGAYQVATQEARTKGIEFSKVQFQLAADRETGKPGWTVQMADAKDQRVGAIKVNADSGTIVSSAWGADAPNLVAQRTSENSDERFLNSSESQTPAHNSKDEEAAPMAKATPEKQTPRYAQEQEQVQQQQQYADEPGQYGQPSQSGQQSGSITDRAGNIGRKVVNRVERPFLRAGGWIQKKFTGQDTISPPRTKDDDDDDDDNRSNDQYNKPVHPVPQ